MEPGSPQRRLGSASAASVQRCAVGPEAKAASAHSAAAAASGVRLTQASSASQCAAVCARVLPPVPAEAQTLTVSLKKRERREAWRRTAECSVITSEKISGCGSEEGFIQRIV